MAKPKDNCNSQPKPLIKADSVVVLDQFPYTTPTNFQHSHKDPLDGYSFFFFYSSSLLLFVCCI